MDKTWLYSGLACMFVSGLFFGLSAGLFMSDQRQHEVFNTAYERGFIDGETSMMIKLNITGDTYATLIYDNFSDLDRNWSNTS